MGRWCRQKYSDTALNGMVQKKTEIQRGENIDTVTGRSKRGLTMNKNRKAKGWKNGDTP